MEIKDIIDYVEKTPANTNPNVLVTMLEELGGGGGQKLSEFTLEYYTGDEDYNSTILFFEEGMTWKDFVDSKYNPEVDWDPLLTTDEENEVNYLYKAIVRKDKGLDNCIPSEQIIPNTTYYVYIG